MLRQTQGAMLCPSCRKLISVSVERCPFCGAARPGLWGYGPGIHRFFGRIDPVSVITTACIGLYVVALAMEPRAVFRAGGSVFGLLSPDPNALRFLGSTASFDLLTGRWWTVLTAIYLHGGVLHILFNLMWARSLGTELQRAFGPWRFFIIWSLSGALGFLLSDLVPGPPSVGASGSLFGLMAGMIVYGRAVGASMVTRQIWTYAIVLGLMGFIFPGVDNFAHVGGFAGGWITATVLRPSIGRPEGRGARLLGVLLMALTLAGFVANVGTGLAFLAGRALR
jgi:rhomboid protease GluP